MINLIKQLAVNFNKNIITFQYIGSDKIVYQTQKNQFIKDSGLTIKNPTTEIPAYLLELNQWGSSLLCGHIIDNIAGYLQGSGLSDIILIVDFSGVKEVSSSFCEQYLNFMLTTTSKIININQNTSINNTFVAYLDNVIDYQEVFS